MTCANCGSDNGSERQYAQFPDMLFCEDCFSRSGVAVVVAPKPEEKDEITGAPV